MRDVPDVSLTASPFHDPYNVFTIDPSTGQDVEISVGGTSASAQVFAGIVALLNQSLAKAGSGTAGNINPNLYALARTPGVFHDITMGNNTVPCATDTPDCSRSSGSFGYSAGPGYDLVTGLGSVDVSEMVACWSDLSGPPRFRPSAPGQGRHACHPAVPATTVVTANPELIFTNGSTEIEAVVSPPGGRYISIPTGTVTFSAGSAALGTVALAGGLLPYRPMGASCLREPTPSTPTTMVTPLSTRLRALSRSPSMRQHPGSPSAPARIRSSPLPAWA
jgi:trimeric autotransporter adhesin